MQAGGDAPALALLALDQFARERQPGRLPPTEKSVQNSRKTPWVALASESAGKTLPSSRQGITNRPSMTSCFKPGPSHATARWLCSNRCS